MYTVRGITIFFVKSFLLRPTITIHSLDEISASPETFFIGLEDQTEIKKIVQNLDFRFLEGAIILKHGKEILLDFSYYDYIDQLWGYFLNLIEEELNCGFSKTYFPDMPVELTLTEISRELVRFSVDNQNNWVLPKVHFYTSLLDGAASFYKNIKKYSPEQYDFEMEKIKNLRNKIS